MAVTRAKYHEKATLLYACPQIDEETSALVPANEFPGDVIVTSGSTAVTGVDTKFLSKVAPGIYLALPNGRLIGQVSSVSTDTALTLVSPATFSVQAAPVYKIPLTIASPGFNLDSPISAGDTITVGNATISKTTSGLPSYIDLVKSLEHLVPGRDKAAIDSALTTAKLDTQVTFGTGTTTFTSTYTYALDTVSTDNKTASIRATAVSATETGQPSMTVTPAASFTTISYTPIGTSTATANNKVHTAMGPNNAIAAINMNFSLDLTSEAYQYTGDALDRDENTVITDKIAKIDFESFVPSLNNASDTPDVTATSSQLPYVNMFRAAGLAIKTGTSAALSGLTDTTKLVKLTNSVEQNVFLTMEYRRSSLDLPNIEKTYTLKGVRGTVDLDATVGTKAKLKWNFLGNLASIRDKQQIIKDKSATSMLGILKKSIAGNLNTETITSAKISPKDIYITEVEFAKSITTTAEVSIRIGAAGGIKLVLNTGTTFSGSDIAKWIAAIAPGMSVDDINANLGLDILEDKAIFKPFSTSASSADTKYQGSYTFTAIQNDNKEYTKLQATPIAPSVGTSSGFSFPVTGMTSTQVVTDTENKPASPTYSEIKNICFDKLTAANLTGYEYNRYKTGCFDGWSKGATPTDVAMTILEDSANASYNPNRFLENIHMLWLGYKSGGDSVIFEFDKLQLTNITNSTVASFAGQDLTFRNIGFTSLYLKGAVD